MLLGDLRVTSPAGVVELSHWVGKHDMAITDQAIDQVFSDLKRTCAATFSSAEQFLLSDRIGDSPCFITDLRVPGMSGAELQDVLIADGYVTPIIFMTGSRDEAVAHGY
jgi:FixJ family two-component response regulator